MEREALCVHILDATPEMFCVFWTAVRAGLGNKGETRPCFSNCCICGQDLMAVRCILHDLRNFRQLSVFTV